MQDALKNSPVKIQYIRSSSMANSAIRYRKDNVFVSDSQLGDWIKAVTNKFDYLIAQGVNVEWLLLACDQWCEIFENFPPGLKDIELDEALADDDRKKIFIDVLKSVVNEIDGNDYNLAAAKEISAKVLNRLFKIR